MLERLVRAGLDVARTYEMFHTVFRNTGKYPKHREVAEKTDRRVAVDGGFAGLKMRLGKTAQSPFEEEAAGPPIRSTRVACATPARVWRGGPRKASETSLREMKRGTTCLYSAAIRVAAQIVRCEPELSLEAEVGGGVVIRGGADSEALV